MAWRFCTLLFLVGCAGRLQVESQPARYKYLESKVAENIRTLTQCDQATLTLKESKKVATTWFDTYKLEGCGQVTDYMTALTESGTWITWQFGTVPPPDQLRAVAKERLTKTAEFDLNCASGLELTILNETMDAMHSTLIASIGVRGCDKQSTYRTTCTNVNYNKGEHEFACTSVVTSVTSN